MEYFFTKKVHEINHKQGAHDWLHMMSLNESQIYCLYISIYFICSDAFSEFNSAYTTFVK